MNADFFKIGWKKKRRRKNVHKQNTRIARISRDQKLEKSSTALWAMMFEKRKQGNNRVSINGRFMANDSAENQAWQLCVHA